MKDSVFGSFGRNRRIVTLLLLFSTLYENYEDSQRIPDKRHARQATRIKKKIGIDTALLNIYTPRSSVREGIVRHTRSSQFPSRRQNTNQKGDGTSKKKIRLARAAPSPRVFRKLEPTKWDVGIFRFEFLLCTIFYFAPKVTLPSPPTRGKTRRHSLRGGGAAGSRGDSKGQPSPREKPSLCPISFHSEGFGRKHVSHALSHKTIQGGIIKPIMNGVSESEARASAPSAPAEGHA
ncbi:hypothetical protein EVAR_20195_1 [Eumeta japonica]|uniref:Uncharacterized protein n=1 Tax=Eumeta variegata TaxID=151549 RepID=A0A4C1UV49_EUMVA|nr:hypothetical protein EVAR_20195_1 [Eumeta japonica]